MRTTLTLAIALTCAGVFAQDEALLFYSDFDGDPAADFSVGEAPATLNGAPRFVEGRLGQAVVVGGDNWLSYPAEGNLRGSQGTIEFWLSPVDWDGRDNQRSHFFVGAQGADRIYIYKFIRWRHFTFHCNPEATTKYESLRAGVYPWQIGEWHHAAVTWDRAVMRIYLDGELCAEGAIPAPISDLGDTLFVGKDLATPQFEHGETAIDELRVYSRPLFADEIKRAYARADNPDAVVETTRDVIIYYTGYPTENRAEMGFVSTVAVPDGGSATLTIADPATGEQAVTQALSIGPGGTIGDCEIDTSGLSSANYDVTVRIADAAGGVLVEAVRKLNVRDRFWKREPAGIADKVPPPWTPLEVAGDSVRCWGREYRLDGRGGIGPIESRDETLLTRPIGWQVDGKRSEAAASWRKVASDALEARFEAEQVVGGLKITQQATFEYDGFVRLDYSIEPAGGDADVDSLIFEIPMRAEIAKYLQTATQGIAYYESGEIHDASWPASAVFSLFVGDEDRGICLVQEGGAKLPNQDEETQLEIKTGERETVIRANVISEPTTLTEPLELSFGIQATPVRPMADDWRAEWRPAPRLGQNPDPTGAEEFGAKVAFIWWSDSPQTQKWFGFPEPSDPDAFRAMVDDFHARGIKVLLYSNLTCASPNVSEAIEYSGELFRRPQTIPLPAADQAPGAERGRWLRVDLRHPDWADYIVGYQAKVMDEYGVDGWYFDCATPYIIDGAHPIFEYREACKRAYVAVKQHDPEGLVITHMSSHYMAPSLAFNDAMLQGEQFRWEVPEFYVTDDYTKVLRLDYARTELTGRNLGTVPVFLPEFPGGVGRHRNRRNTEHLLAVTRLHDMVLWPIWCDSEPVGEQWQALDRFGIAEADTEFLPYWEDAPPAVADHEEVLVSAYRRDGGALLVVSNFLGHEDRTVKVTPNLEALGLAAGFTASDMMTGEVISVANGSLQIQLLEGRMRLVHLAPAQ